MATVQRRIADAARAAGRTPEHITLVAASKTRSPAEVREAALAGVRVFGENYVQELLDKAQAAPDLEWHFIGHLQRNKAKKLIPWIDVLHSVDSERLADAVDKVASRRRRPLAVLLQVNLAHEETKAGLAPSDTLALARHILGQCPALSLRGLMTIPPPDDTPGRWFEALRRLRDQLQETTGHVLPDLSMGMSGDLEEAIAQGATYVRVGTDLFGPREG